MMTPHQNNISTGSLSQEEEGDQDVCVPQIIPVTEGLLGRALQFAEQPVHEEGAILSSTSTTSSSFSFQSSTYNSTNNNNNNNPIYDPFIPLHSDYTIPWSNVSAYPPPSPPPESRRTVFGGRVDQKYHVAATAMTAATASRNGSVSRGKHPPHGLRQTETTQHLTYTPTVTTTATTDDIVDVGHNTRTGLTNGYNSLINHGVSDLSAESSDDNALHHPLSSELTPSTSPSEMDSHHCRNLITHSSPTKKITTKQKQRVVETVHAQSLVLGLAFMAIWSPQNCMAPNLTQMAEDFGFSDKERDFYLGANVAFATGVLSLPIAGGIGILADVYNRKYLFCATVALGGISAYLTGASQTYRALFFARLLNGAFMSGATPVAFSLLGDLFDTHERNAASSGLTAMMGLGIIIGQVYAGVVGSNEGWEHAFYVSSAVTLISALLVLLLVREPIRGGKEEVLQDMLRRGTRYERKLTWNGFVQTMRNNKSNMILMWQGFFSSVPWGIIFVFLNDYLSQERGFSVPDATYLVAVFGAGCAVGGILGGYWGGIVESWNRSYLPIFMAVTTFMGIFPFIGLLNGTFLNAHGLFAVGYSFLGGFIASLPSVCVRPCLINVNPPETRGAALTAANLIINLARGAGPSCITLLGAVFHIDRQTSFNITLSVFWTFSAGQLFFLSKTLPTDQDAMTANLAAYAAAALSQHHTLMEDEEEVVSIEERMASWDAGAARQSMEFVGAAFKEIGDEIRIIKKLNMRCTSRELSDEEEENDREFVENRRQAWIEHQKQLTWPTEHSPLV